jgi:SEC-C motif-containing protein
MTRLGRVLREECPCPSGLPYDACCGRLHRGAAVAVTAEELMRSRYAAYVRGEESYLLATWHPRTRPPSATSAVVWTGLEIVSTLDGGAEDETGEVEFVARHEGGTLHERSRFSRRGGRWVYVDGDII